MDIKDKEMADQAAKRQFRTIEVPHSHFKPYIKYKQIYHRKTVSKSQKLTIS